MGIKQGNTQWFDKNRILEMKDEQAIDYIFEVTNKCM